MYDQYLSHVTPVNLMQPYLATSGKSHSNRWRLSLNQADLPIAAQAQQLNKPYVMFETNTASCGGFAGLSDSFGAAL